MPEQRSEQPNLPGFSELDLDLLKINSGRAQQGLSLLRREDILPPQPSRPLTAENLCEAGSRQSNL